jgi:hypothetical protein
MNFNGRMINSGLNESLVNGEVKQGNELLGKKQYKLKISA